MKNISKQISQGKRNESAKTQDFVNKCMNSINQPIYPIKVEGK
jgi:hypothetical protein